MNMKQTRLTIVWSCQPCSCVICSQNVRKFWSEGFLSFIFSKTYLTKLAVLWTFFCIKGSVFLYQRVGPLQVGQKTNIFRTFIATINRELRSWPLKLIFLIFNDIKKLEKDSSNRHLWGPKIVSIYNVLLKRLYVYHYWHSCLSWIFATV